MIVWLKSEHLLWQQELLLLELLRLLELLLVQPPLFGQQLLQLEPLLGLPQQQEPLFQLDRFKQRYYQQQLYYHHHLPGDPLIPLS